MESAGRGDVAPREGASESGRSRPYVKHLKSPSPQSARIIPHGGTNPGPDTCTLIIYIWGAGGRGRDGPGTMWFGAGSVEDLRDRRAAPPLPREHNMCVVLFMFCPSGTLIRYASLVYGITVQR